jgi:hypothetical protein
VSRALNDPKKPCRIADEHPSRWKGIAEAIMPSFEVDGDSISQRRLLKGHEKALQKSQSRAHQGSLGGQANALKNKESAVANATGSLRQKLGIQDQNQHQPGEKGSSENPKNLNNDVPAGAGSTDAGFAFDARTIRLRAAELERWQKAFPHLSLEAELWELDHWAGSRTGSSPSRPRWRRRDGRWHSASTWRSFYAHSGTPGDKSDWDASSLPFLPDV